MLKKYKFYKKQE